MLNTLAEYGSHGPPLPPLLLTALDLGTHSPLAAGVGPGSLSTRNAWRRPDLSLVSCLKQHPQGSVKKKNNHHKYAFCIELLEKFILNHCSQILCMLLHFSSSLSFLAEKCYHSVLPKRKDTNIRSCYYFETALSQMVY